MHGFFLDIRLYRKVGSKFSYTSLLYYYVLEYTGSYCNAISICHSVAFQTRVGGDVQSAIGTGGLTSSAGTIVHLLLTSGDDPSHVGRVGNGSLFRTYDPTRLPTVGPDPTLALC